MNRALPLILLAALAAGGLGFFALSEGQGPPGPAPLDPAAPTRDRSASPQPTISAPEASPDLAKPVRTVRKPRPRTDGVAKWLEIVPINERGQQVPDATVVAEKNGERLEGTGRIRWESLEAGEWTITVEAADLPTWERTLVLGKDEKRREAARLSERLRIEGQIVDVYGEPLAKQQVYLLPRGKSHPTREEIETRRNELNQPETGPTNGAIGVTTLANGRFRATLPSAGEWRVSVGLPGKAHWTQKKAVELTIGGPDQLIAVVPAKARLTVTTDPELATELRPTQVSAYAFDAQLATRLSQQRAEHERVKRAMVDMKNERQRLGEMTKQELRAGGGKLSQGALLDKSSDRRAVRSQKEMNQIAYERGMASLEAEAKGLSTGAAGRARLFGEGWRPVGSSRFSPDGEAVMRSLPTDTEIQFLFTRGRERITTSVGARLKAATRSVATFELPRFAGDENKILMRRGEARVRVSSDEIADAARLETGVTWSVDG